MAGLPTLADAFSSITCPDPLPPALPVAHVTSARWFSDIVDQSLLTPRWCKHFTKELLYFFYGGAFYRPENIATRNVTELPVAFVFSPTLLSNFHRLYPFDTGALASGRCGSWSGKWQEFRETLYVETNGATDGAQQLVCHLYGDNRRYLKGEVNGSCRTKPQPIPQLRDFLVDDLTGEGVDHRQCTVECQFGDPIRLDQQLLWVAFPEHLTDVFARLFSNLQPHVPEFHSYPSHRNFNPAMVAAQLEDRARTEIVERFVSRPEPGK